jgi:Carboxypeptidase regulatory-like domain
MVVSLLFASCSVHATIFSSVRGIAHDPQHRPVAGANLQLKSRTSAFSLTAQSDPDGQFTFSGVPIGDYDVTVTAPGFEASAPETAVVADSSPVLLFMRDLASVQQTATVSAEPTPANVESVTPTTLSDRQDIAQTPGTDRTNTAQMISDYVPASYVPHDMMHMRGGHQVNWLIDGVPIPNTNIAANLGPQIITDA